jgi:hypothetical protein
MKKVEDSFETRELTCSVFSYSVAEFKKLKANKESAKWEEDLNDNSSSYPIYAGSPFDKKGLGLSTSIDEEPDAGTVYVVPYYLYAQAEYSIDQSIDKNFEIKLAPIVGGLMDERPMDWAEKDEDQVYFEGQGASDGSDFAVNFYYKNKLIESVPLADVDDALLGRIAKSLG